MSLFKKARDRFEFLYEPEMAEALVQRLRRLIEQYGFEPTETAAKYDHWSERDAVVITYADVLQNSQSNGTSKVRLLERFLKHYVGDGINSVHLLPFFPSSSDEGFSVIDYKKVRDDIGTWEDIEHLAGEYRVMADLVINHASRSSDWFKRFEDREDEWKSFFIDVEPSTDLSEVMRPRSSPLLTAVETREGTRHVWTTFSDDQIDLNFSNPEVLCTFLDIFLFYLSKGIKMLRLDAIAYLWKRIGTNSIHLEETHQVVKLFRDIVDHIDPEVTLITETNVPFEENLSYFGDGDEAHMIYQFSLPPLLLHALLTESSQYLTKWAARLPEPPENCSYFNFTASHDGIGVRPLEGLVPDEEFERLVEGVKERGGFVSYKKNRDGSHSPYELNITFFDAFREPTGNGVDEQLARYICSQLIMLSLKGVPGIYFHNLIAAENYTDGVIKTGKKRSINRQRWEWDELKARLEQHDSVSRKTLEIFKKLLDTRRRHSAFHPDGGQEIHKISRSVFALTRTAPDNSEAVLAISNVTGTPVEITSRDSSALPERTDGLRNLLDGGEQRAQGGSLYLKPWETVWLQL